jgi:hypothetical protein
MRFGAPVVTVRGVSIAELPSEPAPDQRFEALVDCGKGDSRQLTAHAQEDFFGGWVDVRSVEEAVHCDPLGGTALASTFQDPAQILLDGIHRSF